jgi:hypothetical protein
MYTLQQQQSRVTKSHAMADALEPTLHAQTQYFASPGAQMMGLVPVSCTMQSELITLRVNRVQN